jgi:hypothetical protein
MNNITPRPITASDHTDHSRDASGLNKWSRSSRTVDFIMSVLGWFAIPVEVFLRRDFGQRWFTTVNYYAGLFLLLILATIQYVIIGIVDFFRNLINDFVSSIDPFYEGEYYENEDGLMDYSMSLLLIAYLLIGAYHLFKIWWRNRTNTALHSFSDGTSRLEPLAGFLMKLINPIVAPLLQVCVFLLPKKQRGDDSVPELIADRTAFANTVVEPLLLLFLAYKLNGMVSFWLFISAIALAIHASWRETAKLNKILDFRDSIFDAKAMMQLRTETQQATPQQEMMQQVAVTLRDAPQISSRMVEQYPDLMDIIEDLNNDKSHLQTS